MAFFMRHVLLLVLLLLDPTLGSAQRLADRATIIDSHSELKARYDYIVVGGGTSGLTVAYRLTEDSSGTLFARTTLGSQSRTLTFSQQHSFGPGNRIWPNVNADFVRPLMAIQSN